MNWRVYQPTNASTCCEDSLRSTPANSLPPRPSSILAASGEHLAKTFCQELLFIPKAAVVKQMVDMLEAKNQESEKTQV